MDTRPFAGSFVTVTVGAVGGVAHVVTRSAGGLRKVQSGFVRHYAAVTVCAVAVFVVYLIARAG